MWHDRRFSCSRKIKNSFQISKRSERGLLCKQMLKVCLYIISYSLTISLRAFSQITNWKCVLNYRFGTKTFKKILTRNEEDAMAKMIS